LSHKNILPGVPGNMAGNLASNLLTYSKNICPVVPTLLLKTILKRVKYGTI
jgi:hypothetical protein